MADSADSSKDTRPATDQREARPWGVGAGKLTIFPPRMPAELWERIRRAEWFDNGWLIDDRPCFLGVEEEDGAPVWKLYFKIHRLDADGTVTEDWEPDPPFKFPLTYRDWVKVASGELIARNNTIEKHGRTFLLLAAGTDAFHKAAVIEFC
jgi:hypothetical protein